MKVFVAGATGAIGRRLVPLLVEARHEVVGLTRSESKRDLLRRMGAEAVVADALKSDELTRVVIDVRPEVIVHQLTSIPPATNLRKLDQQFTLTNRLRTEATETLIAAARRVHARRVVLQSFCGWPFAREGGPIKTEDDPLDANPPPGFRQTLAAIRHLEQAARDASADLEALALRYGFFYGPGTSIARDGPVVEMVCKRRIPIVGDGGGVWSFIHIDDAARATAAAVMRGPSGIYNIVDDEPAKVADWLPYLAEVLGAKPPRRVPIWLARLLVGDEGVIMMTDVRGGSNVKARRELHWRPEYASWRRGFVEGLG